METQPNEQKPPKVVTLEQLRALLAAGTKAEHLPRFVVIRGTTYDVTTKDGKDAIAGAVGGMRGVGVGKRSATKAFVSKAQRRAKGRIQKAARRMQRGGR